MTTKTATHNTVYIFAETSAKAGIAAWAAIVAFVAAGMSTPAAELELANTVTDTNNRSVLQAVIAALRALTKTGQDVVLVSSSKYLVDGITRMGDWKAAGWKTVSKTPVKNQDLWEQLADLTSQHRLGAQFLHGHVVSARASQLAQIVRETGTPVSERRIFAEAKRPAKRKSVRASTTRVIGRKAS